MTPQYLLVNAYETAGKLLHMMVDDLSPAEFAQQPINGGNSVAWIIGHLSNTLAGSAKRLGSDSAPTLEPRFEGKFTTTRRMADVQSDLGTLSELMAAFDAALASVIEAVGKIPDADLDQPPRGRAPFSTTHGGAIQFGASHIIMHAGQISMLRRMFGKPPLV